MKKILKLSKQTILIAVPISLVLSIYANSLLIILFILLFLPDFIKNFKKNNTKKNRKVFFVLIAFIATYFIGFIIDMFYGIVEIKKTERLLPFIVFPLFFLYSNAANVFENKATPLRIFAIFIVFLNIVLLANLFANIWGNYTDSSLENKRWQKKNVFVEKLNTGLMGHFPNSDRISGDASFDRHHLIYNKSLSNDNDTLITRSVYAKTEDDVWLFIRQYDGKTHKGVWFHPKTGKIGFVEEGLTADITVIDDAWYRIAITNPITRDVINERFQISFVDDNKKYEIKRKNDYHVLLGGPQLEISDRASKYRPLDYRSFWEGFDRGDILDSINGHPTYYSLFILVSCLIIYLFVTSNILKLLCFCLNTLMLVLLGSKAGLVSLLILLLLLLIINRKKRDVGTWFLALLIPIIGVIAFFFSNTFQRFDQAVSAVTNNGSDVFLSTEKRIQMWQSVFELPAEGLILGNGNIHGYDLLRDSAALDLNTHNQYLEALLCSGFVGFLFLLAFLLGIFLVDSSTRKNQMILLFMVLIWINLSFENILNRQWGIVFISYFLPYLYNFHVKANEQ